MIDISVWPTTSVRDFFGNFPWQESIPLNNLLPESVEEPFQGNWPCLSVQDFFSRIVWDGQFSTSQESVIPALELSYLLNVQDFFSRVMWQGRPQIGMVPKLNLGQTAIPDLDLNDLADLF